jgi:glycosyltransferase involved in cell wall biosynthesis
LTRPSLSIVIPCYNEQDRLPRTLRKTIEFFVRQSPERKREVEIIVVSDGSKDETVTAAKAALFGLPEGMTSKVIDYSPNEGKGKAIKVGMTTAQYDRVLFMDADYAVPLEDLEFADLLLDQGADIAIGSRALDETILEERQSFLREKMARVFGIAQRNWLGLRLQDMQCGFKLFTREATQAIFPRIKLTSVIFDGEVLWLAKKMKFSVREFPVHWKHDPDSRITYTPRKAVKVFYEMLRIPSLHLGVGRASQKK